MRTNIYHSAILFMIMLIVSACSDTSVEKGPEENAWHIFPQNDTSEYVTPEIKKKPHPMSGKMLIGRDGNIFGDPNSKVSLPTFKSSEKVNDQGHSVVSFHAQAQIKDKEKVKVTLRSTATMNGEKVTRETVGYFCSNKHNVYNLSIQPCSEQMDLSFAFESGSNKAHIESEVFLWDVKSWCAKQGGTNSVETANEKAKLKDIKGNILQAEPPSKVVH